MTSWHAQGVSWLWESRVRVAHQPLLLCSLHHGARPPPYPCCSVGSELFQAFFDSYDAAQSAFEAATQEAPLEVEIKPEELAAAMAAAAAAAAPPAEAPAVVVPPTTVLPMVE